MIDFESKYANFYKLIRGPSKVQKNSMPSGNNLNTIADAVEYHRDLKAYHSRFETEQENANRFQADDVNINKPIEELNKKTKTDGKIKVKNQYDYGLSEKTSFQNFSFKNVKSNMFDNKASFNEKYKPMDKKLSSGGQATLDFFESQMPSYDYNNKSSLYYDKRIYNNAKNRPKTTNEIIDDKMTNEAKANEFYSLFMSSSTSSGLYDEKEDGEGFGGGGPSGEQRGNGGRGNGNGGRGNGNGGRGNGNGGQPNELRTENIPSLRMDNSLVLTERQFQLMRNNMDEDIQDGSTKNINVSESEMIKTINSFLKPSAEDDNRVKMLKDYARTIYVGAKTNKDMNKIKGLYLYINKIYEPQEEEDPDAEYDETIELEPEDYSDEVIEQHLENEIKDTELLNMVKKSVKEDKGARGQLVEKIRDINEINKIVKKPKKSLQEMNADEIQQARAEKDEIIEIARSVIERKYNNEIDVVSQQIRGFYSDYDSAIAKGLDGVNLKIFRERLNELGEIVGYQHVAANCRRVTCVARYKNMVTRMNVAMGTLDPKHISPLKKKSQSGTTTRGNIHTMADLNESVAGGGGSGSGRV